MSGLQPDGEGFDLNLGFLDNIGVPAETREKLAKLQAALEDNLTAAEMQHLQTHQHIAVVKSYASTLAKLAGVLGSIVPLIEVGAAGGVAVDQPTKDSILGVVAELASLIGAGGAPNPQSLLGLLGPLRGDYPSGRGDGA